MPTDGPARLTSVSERLRLGSNDPTVKEDKRINKNALETSVQQQLLILTLSPYWVRCFRCLPTR